MKRPIGGIWEAHNYWATASATAIATSICVGANSIGHRWHLSGIPEGRRQSQTDTNMYLSLFEVKFQATPKVWPSSANGKFQTILNVPTLSVAHNGQ